MNTDRVVVTLDDIVRRHVSDHRKPYYDWLRHLVTLCVATLTALVALQGHYVPRDAHNLFALALCWVALTGAIFLGVLALRQEYLAPLRLHKNTKSRETYGDSATEIMVANRLLQVVPPWHHRFAVTLMLMMLFLALLCLCVFAISNLGSL